jgi:hypothetical protein
MTTSDDLGRIAYNAYCESVGWKSFTGDPLPQWDEVRLDLKLGWVGASVAVAEHLRIHGHDFL